MPDMLSMSAAQKSYPVAVFVDFESGYQATHLAKSLNSSRLIGLTRPARSPTRDYRFSLSLTFVLSTTQSNQLSATCSIAGAIIVVCMFQL